VVSTTLLIELPELGQLIDVKLPLLVWHIYRDSGQCDGKRTVWGGRAKLESRSLYGGIGRSTANPVIASFYERLLKAGKAKKVAL